MGFVLKVLSIFATGVFLMSCADEPELTRAGSTSLNGSTSGNGLFSTECVLASGAIGCKVKLSGSSIKMDHSSLNLQPSFDSYFVDSVDSADVSSLEVVGGGINLTSKTPASSEYTFVFNFLDETRVQEFFQLTAQESSLSNSSSGMLLTIPSKQYSPEGSKKSIKVSHCLIGLIFDSWLNGPGSFSEFEVSGFAEQDFRYQTIIPSNSIMTSAESLAISNTEKWQKIFEGVSASYINSASGCTEEKSQDTPNSVKEFAEGVDDILYDYLVKVHGASKGDLSSAAGL